MQRLAAWQRLWSERAVHEAKTQIGRSDYQVRV